MKSGLLTTFAALLGAFVILFVLVVEYHKQAEVRSAAAAISPSNSPPPPKCLRERKLHVHGTYKQRYGTAGSWAEIDNPVDLTVDECLEWEIAK